MCRSYYVRFATVPWGADRGGGILPSNRPNGDVPLDRIEFSFFTTGLTMMWLLFQ